MSYYTYDHLPDLAAAEMLAAIPLSYKPYTSASETKFESWASYATAEDNALLKSTFSFSVKAGAQYEVISSSYFDPFILRVYDSLGNVIAVDSGGLSYGVDYTVFTAPYSGTFYTSASWDQGIASANKGVAIGIWQDLDAATVRAPNPIQGTTGNDRLTATAANDAVNGGAGFDTINYSGARASYTIVKNGANVSVNPKSAVNQIDTLTGIETIQFTDAALNLEYNDVTQALYIGYFGRAADPQALGSFQTQLAGLKAPTNFVDLSARYGTDASIKNLIDSFGTSAESKALYTGDTKSFVSAVFLNILERAPQADGLNFWANAIDSGSLTRANASLSIMSGALSNVSVQGQLDGTLIGNKISVASNFSFGLDTAAKSAKYAGAAAANTVRGLLIDVDASTDVLAFQQKVNDVLTAITGLTISQSRPEGPFPTVELVASTSPDGTFVDYGYV